MARRVAQMLSVIAGLATGGAAIAQSPTPAPAAVFESLDKNSDGKVTLAEASTDDGLFVAFKSLDTDKNGELSKEEFGAYQKKRTT